MLNSSDVAELLNVSLSKAGNIIRALNNLKVQRGTPKQCIIAGRIDEEFLLKELHLK